VDYESVVIQDLLTFYNRDELNVAPWYQRRAVWNNSQKGYLINTIHEQKPVPSIYIRHTVDLESEKSVKEVVDGQQRVRCILEYRQDGFTASHPKYERPVKYSQLNNVERRNFLLTALSVGYLVNASDEDVIEIFARINSVSKTLNPQEKRNAEFSGAYKQFCLKESVERLPFWRNYAVFTDNNIARMVEVQFISDVVMNLNEGLQDFSAPRLNKYYRDNDDSFPDAPKIKKRLDRLFEILLDQKQDVLRGSIFCVPQILFSLMLILNDLNVSKRKLEKCITDIDSRFRAVNDGEKPNAMTTDVYEAFSSGNMHRIKFRKRRDAVIRAALR
jgi:hypothetical protein